MASVPMSLASAVSIGVSEVFSGAVGGAISRQTAIILGDQKKDTLRTKVSSTGAFFGARGVAGGLARALGLPRPLAVLCGTIAGSLVSEGTKAAGRSDSEQNNRKGTLDIKKSTILEESGLKGSEISGDIVKWLVYDALEDKVMMNYPDFLIRVVLTFLVGCVSAISAIIVKDIGMEMESKDTMPGIKPIIELDIRNTELKNTNTKFKYDDKKIKTKMKKSFYNEDIGNLKLKQKKSDNLVQDEITNEEDVVPVIKNYNYNTIFLTSKYATAAIEGGVLFASYQIIMASVRSIIPKDLDVKFAFNIILENIEKGIDPDFHF
eukprot:CAMPEP_0119039296 /NCGR_PEP_ID=MMETSP1177-20130426/8693_1 /TAXON_ID=2985 /ORGANISM="Ochromonas sp, Strain CCMP1899" /LENGTH=320 /DNA_ID=CAMNT_0007002977 /DNA_START=354 /DNA_END=1316 /DNA_ORIENTATION=-